MARRMRKGRVLAGGAFLGAMLAIVSSAAAASFEAGFSKIDITPAEPVRLSGYGSRAKPSEGVDTPLFVRGMALRADDGPLHVLLSVDTIGFPAALTKEIFQAVQKKHSLSRSQFVICCTHSHTAPHLLRGLTNLFSVPLSEAERRANGEYTDLVRDRCIEAVGAAVENLQPVRLSVAEGTASFAKNRRVLENGIWKGFGVNPQGPVDHSLPVIFLTEKTGEKVRGILFNYACHCTTFGGNYNRVNGDWAGYAASGLEKTFEGSVALCTIGCGADQNPNRDPEKALMFAQAQGAEITEEVTRLHEGDSATSLGAAMVSSFGFAGLPIDRPTLGQLKENLKNSRVQVRRHAEEMLEIHRRMGRLPETYPMPIQVWRFGDEFCMVFLGGEVCVDYALRIKKELGKTLAKGAKVWVSAYANDVFGYVAPERMRSEGGYEVDFSMIYYMQPGRWSSGTEEVILRRVHELFASQGGDRPLSLHRALETFSLPEGYQLEVVAAEPLIADPINFVVDARGRLWVVEMGDYPRGNPLDAASNDPHAKRAHPWSGQPFGRIRVLYDRDQDGRYDESRLFLDGLTFPTGLFPWKDGVLISGAPDIVFARDTDGDDRCDHVEVLYSGFREENPQHRVNGFAFGLNGWLYLAGGVSNGRITCQKTGEVVNVSGRDLRIHPESGRLEPVSGLSQYGRCRDDRGNWYGNTNSEPLFTFMIEDRVLRRNPYVPSPSPRISLTRPAWAPAVFPTSRTVDRFNDLFAENRFTSACSPCCFRDPVFGEEVYGSVFICEPVHNLVSRILPRREGLQWVGERHPNEQASEFLSSTDQWFRPVRLMTGPDRCLWICDMYRHVIEHPQWIPEAWQEKLDLYAGSDRGRIYRLVRKDSPRKPVPRLDRLSSIQLVAELAHPNGWRRDTAQRLLFERHAALPPNVEEALEKLLKEHTGQSGLIQAMWTYVHFYPQREQHAWLRKRFLRSEDVELVIQGIRAMGIAADPDNDWQPEELRHHDEIRVRYEVALAAGELDPSSRLVYLSALAKRDAEQPWMRTALLSSATEVAGDLLQFVSSELPSSSGRSQLMTALIATALGEKSESALTGIFRSLAPEKGNKIEAWQMEMLAACLHGLRRRSLNWEQMSTSKDRELALAASAMSPLFEQARRLVLDPQAETALRVAAIQVLGHSAGERQQDLARLRSLLVPSSPPEIQRAALERLAELKDFQTVLSGLEKLTPNLQATAQTILLSHQREGDLIAAVKSGQVKPQSLTAATVSALTNHRNRTIRQAAMGLFGDRSNSSRDEVVAKYGQVAELTGDAGHGRIVFEKRCASCHRHQGLGTDAGPKLSALQNKSTEHLLVSILDPNRSVEAKYRAVTVVTSDGRLHSGMILEETATSFLLARTDGKRETVLRRDVESLSVSAVSFMPEGLEKDLDVQDLADVMAFIRQKATASAP